MLYDRTFSIDLNRSSFVDCVPSPNTVSIAVKTSPLVVILFSAVSLCLQTAILVANKVIHFVKSGGHGLKHLELKRALSSGVNVPLAKLLRAVAKSKSSLWRIIFFFSIQSVQIVPIVKCLPVLVNRSFCLVEISTDHQRELVVLSLLQLSLIIYQRK